MALLCVRIARCVLSPPGDTLLFEAVLLCCARIRELSNEKPNVILLRSTIIDRAAFSPFPSSLSHTLSLSFAAFVLRRPRSTVAVVRTPTLLLLLRLAFLRRLGCGLKMGDPATPEGRRLLHLFIVRLLYALEWGRALGPIIAFGRLIELFIPLSSSVRRLVAFHVRGRRRGIALLVRVCLPPLVQQLYRVHKRYRSLRAHRALEGNVSIVMGPSVSVRPWRRSGLAPICN